jgi:hypothetical protein
MSAKDRLLTRVGSILEKTAAAILWKYSDPEGAVFYLEERRLGTIRSPFTGKTFTPKPVRQSLTDVAKELRSSGAKVKGALWKYVDPEGGSFYCSQRLIGSIKSPFTGKTFPAKPVKFTLSEVSKDLRLDKAGPEDSDLGDVSAMEEMLQAKGYDPEGATKLQDEGVGIIELEERLKDPEQFDMEYGIPRIKVAEVKVAAPTSVGKKNAGSQEQWELAAAIIKDRESHPAIKVIKDRYAKVLAALEECDKHSKRVGADHTENHTFIMTYVAPEIQQLADTCQVVAKQLEQRLGRIK